MSWQTYNKPKPCTISKHPCLLPLFWKVYLDVKIWKNVSHKINSAFILIFGKHPYLSVKAIVGSLSATCISTLWATLFRHKIKCIQWIDLPRTPDWVSWRILRFQTCSFDPGPPEASWSFADKLLLILIVCEKEKPLQSCFYSLPSFLMGCVAMC